MDDASRSTVTDTPSAPPTEAASAVTTEASWRLRSDDAFTGLTSISDMQASEFASSSGRTATDDGTRSEHTPTASHSRTESTPTPSYTQGSVSRSELSEPISTSGSGLSRTGGAVRRRHRATSRSQSTSSGGTFFVMWSPRWVRGLIRLPQTTQMGVHMMFVGRRHFLILLHRLGRALAVLVRSWCRRRRPQRPPQPLVMSMPAPHLEVKDMLLLGLPPLSHRTIHCRRFRHLSQRQNTLPRRSRKGRHTLLQRYTRAIWKAYLRS
jgi:hypothetical protein